jgi:hypothetical protein
MKEALDKMLAGDSGTAPDQGEMDLSAFEEQDEEGEDKKLIDGLASAGFMGIEPEKIKQIKDILGNPAEDALDGSNGEPPPPVVAAKPKSKMDSLFGGGGGAAKAPAKPASKNPFA